jgi:hypothetical protein
LTILVSLPLPVANGANITNHTIPSRDEMSPPPINVNVEFSDTTLPGAKGEMAASLMSIGFSADPSPSQYWLSQLFLEHPGCGTW